MFLEVELGIVNTVHFMPIAVALSLYVIHTSNQQLLSMHSRHINIISTHNYHYYYFWFVFNWPIFQDITPA